MIKTIYEWKDEFKTSDFDFQGGKALNNWKDNQQLTAEDYLIGIDNFANVKLF